MNHGAFLPRSPHGALTAMRCSDNYASLSVIKCDDKLPRFWRCTRDRKRRSAFNNEIHTDLLIELIICLCILHGTGKPQLHVIALHDNATVSSPDEQDPATAMYVCPHSTVGAIPANATPGHATLGNMRLCVMYCMGLAH